MKNKLSTAALIAALLVAVLIALHHLDMIGFIKRLHGG
jgi:hypothetical protein